MSQPVTLPKWVDLALAPALNVATAFAISALVVLAIGENPVAALRALVAGSLGSWEGLGFTLYYATNFIFTGLAVALAYRAGLFNIGGEGQAYVAGLGAALVCLHLDFLPAILLIPAGIAGAAAFGAAWALLPAWLQARRGSHIVITTIMFNWLATTLLAYLLVNVLREPQSMQPETRVFVPAAKVPQLHDMAAGLGLKLPATPLNLSFFLALVCAGLVWLLLWRTRLGYEIRTVGISPTAAQYAGISNARIIMIAMALSGALCGGLAVNEIMGVQNRLLLEFTSGYGFVGIAVALMGRAHPVGVVLAALLFGMLYQGGTELAFDQPKITRDMIVVIQGLVVLFAGALEGVFRKPLARLFSPRPAATTT
ncbi:MAG: ABC transporter permease [Methylobacteriaceae bacterium]|nr:ABC transporter permease [Methylobacteriaceae bacterium]